MQDFVFRGCGRAAGVFVGLLLVKSDRLRQAGKKKRL